MATRMRIAAAACLVVAGLFVGGAGAALAFADPEAGQSGESGGTQADPTNGGTTAPTAEQTPAETTTSESTAVGTATVTAAKPTSQVGDGRNGSPLLNVDVAPGTGSSSKQSASGAATTPQIDPTGAGEPTSTTTRALAPDVRPTAEDDPETHPGWQWWPWCWPGPGLPPGDGSPPSSGNGGGGVSSGKPPIGIGIPKPPPLMQLPAPTIPGVVPPTLPGISVDPVVDVIDGLATAAAQLPFAPLALPAIVPPVGAGGGAGGAGGPGVAPRPGAPAAPRPSSGLPSKNQAPKAQEQNPPAFGASNGAAAASYRAGYGEYLRTAGVGQMAAVAVPGVTGILVLTAAGGVLGFRQARAGHAVRANGTARFMG